MSEARRVTELKDIEFNRFKLICHIEEYYSDAAHVDFKSKM